MMIDVAGVEAECVRVDQMTEIGEEVVWEDIVRGRNVQVVGDQGFKQRFKEDIVQRGLQGGPKFQKGAVLDGVKGDGLSYSVNEVLSKYEYDETKYIQSLDLKSLQKKLFQNLHKCMGTFGKIEEI